MDDHVDIALRAWAGERPIAKWLVLCANRAGRHPEVRQVMGHVGNQQRIWGAIRAVNQFKHQGVHPAVRSRWWPASLGDKRGASLHESMDTVVARDPAMGEAVL